MTDPRCQICFHFALELRQPYQVYFCIGKLPFQLGARRNGGQFFSFLMYAFYLNIMRAADTVGCIWLKHISKILCHMFSFQIFKFDFFPVHSKCKCPRWFVKKKSKLHLDMKYNKLSWYVQFTADLSMQFTISGSRESKKKIRWIPFLMSLVQFFIRLEHH